MSRPQVGARRLDLRLWSQGPRTTSGFGSESAVVPLLSGTQVIVRLWHAPGSFRIQPTGRCIRRLPSSAKSFSESPNGSKKLLEIFEASQLTGSCADTGVAPVAKKSARAQTNPNKHRRGSARLASVKTHGVFFPGSGLPKCPHTLIQSRYFWTYACLVCKNLW